MVVMRRMGRRLREMRDTAEMVLIEAALRVNLSDEVLRRIECGDFLATPPLVRSLMRLYDQHDPALLDLLAQARQVGWWSDYRYNEEYLAWEASAVDTYELATARVPDLLQTNAYAGTLWTKRTAHLASPHDAERMIQANVEALTLRQCRLVYRPTLRLHTIVTEAAVRAPVGSEVIMLAQWLRLHRVASSWRAVDLRILPTDAAAQTRSEHGWEVLDFAETEEPARLFRKTGSLQPLKAISSETAVQRAQQQFDRLLGACLSHADSVAFLDALIDEAIATHPIAIRT
jgi:hypothetical protein